MLIFFLYITGANAYHQIEWYLREKKRTDGLVHIMSNFAFHRENWKPRKQLASRKMD
ncbi:hypothetical protein Sjap_000441 [Stephania japonica]|uniref:Uncharacterized protein n=1 Tax=Stephania japonica TaxID=461633 RepID=A0AAP0KI25_9MAGN